MPLYDERRMDPGVGLAAAGPKGLDLNTVVCASPNEVSSRVGDEAAILDLDTATYYSLDSVGARIFDLLQSPVPLGDVLTAVVREYEVDEATARTDLFALINDLIDNRLVVTSPGHAP